MRYDELWQEIDPLYAQILQHPFVKEIGEGNLCSTKFDAYIEQDVFYLADFAQAHRLTGAKSSCTTTTEKISELAEAVSDSLERLHTKYAPTPKKRGQICHAYTNFLLETTRNESFPVAIASLLPCYCIYRELGKHFLTITPPSNPYSSWIANCCSEEFLQNTSEIVAIFSAAAQNASDEEKQKMKHVFKQGAEWEYLFWEEAYHGKIALSVH